MLDLIGEIAGTLLESFNLSPKLLVVVLLLLIAIWLWTRRVRFELSEDASPYWVNFATNRVYRSAVYEINYPKPLAFLVLWLHDLSLEYHLSCPRALQLEQVSYRHPDHSPLDEPTAFHRLGKLIVEDDRVIQIIPRAIATEILASHEPAVGLIPFYKKLRGVRAVVMEISYPREGYSEENIVSVERSINQDERFLRFVIHKNTSIARIQQYRLRHELEASVKSFVLPPECPPEARLPTNPQDISILSTRAIDEFDRDQPTEGNTLDWVFDIILETTEIRLRYEAD